MKGGHPFSVTLFLTRDPVDLGPAASPSELFPALDLETLDSPRVLPLAPRVALVHSLMTEGARVAVRWVTLRHAPASWAGVGPVEAAVVLTAPIHQGGTALRLVSRLRACLQDPVVVDTARLARTREELVRILAAAERTAGESPLSAPALLALLGSAPAGLTVVEAARRLQQCGHNRIERVRRRPLVLRFLEQFWSFFALLLWVGGGLALLAGLPQFGWAIFAVIVVNGVFSFFQEYRAERAVEALQQLLPHQITVIRPRVRLSGRGSQEPPPSRRGSRRDRDPGRAHPGAAVSARLRPGPAGLR